MATNAIAISRTLVESGLELPAANAIAEVVVTHADDTVATKADLAKLDTKIEVLSTKVDALTSSVKGQTNMIYGLYVGLAVLVVNAVTGA